MANLLEALHWGFLVSGKKMRYERRDIVFQEVPGEVTLAYSIIGCRMACKGCHSPHLRKTDIGQPLTEKLVLSHLDEYKGLITCVLFLGGDQHPTDLRRLLQLVQAKGLKTCLYTGRTKIAPQLEHFLTYLKTGPWVESLGGLDSPTTNQRFIHVPSGKDLTSEFLCTN